MHRDLVYHPVYTTEEVNQILHKFHTDDIIAEDYITEGVIDKAFTAYGEFMLEVGLNAMGIIKVVKEYGARMGDVIRKEGINSNSIKELTTLFEQCTEHISVFFRDIRVPNKLAGYDINRMKAALCLFLTVLTINTMIMCLLMLLGPITADVLTTVVVAPIVEEFAKSVAIKGKFGTEFTVVMNAYEMVYYVNQMKRVPGIGILKAIRVRAFVVLMHLTTTIIQWLSNNQKLLDMIGVKKEDKGTISFIGRILGIVIHSIWNFLSKFNMKFVSMLLGV